MIYPLGGGGNFENINFIKIQVGFNEAINCSNYYPKILLDKIIEEDKFTLVSNKFYKDGQFIHYEEKSTSTQLFQYSECRGNAEYILIELFGKGKPADLEKIVLNNILLNFQWSLSNLIEYLSNN